MTKVQAESLQAPRELLDAANNASEKIAALHIAFLALCTYILVIVFSTTDMDLLIGKGVKLPVVDVEVPIKGFYLTAPYLIVLVHFNLLIQLQLLSRKLFAFDEAARGTGGLHDQLHIFPYNYYLVGRQNKLIHAFITILITTTILALPYLSLITLQARFLAYQDEVVTWTQRLATWLDITLIAILWPVMMDRNNSWRNYTLVLYRDMKHRWLWYTWLLTGIIAVIWTIESRTNEHIYTDTVIFATPIASWLLLTLVSLIIRCGHHLLRHRRHLFIKPANTTRWAEFHGFLIVLPLALLIPLSLSVDGEPVDNPSSLRTTMLDSLRHLDLHEQILLSAAVQGDTLGKLRNSDALIRTDVLRTIQPINLQGRSLRHADLRKAWIVKADLRNARLHGANLESAHLQGVDLTSADLREANLRAANLQGALLQGARLQRATLAMAEMQGARANRLEVHSGHPRDETVSIGSQRVTAVELFNSSWEVSRDNYQQFLKAELTGADLTGAKLQGANLSGADLQGVRLTHANIQGGNLSYVHLEGAILSWALLQGANLDGAFLNGTELIETQLYNKKIDLSQRGHLKEPLDITWQPLGDNEAKGIMKAALGWFWRSDEDKTEFIDSINQASASGIPRPTFSTCFDYTLETDKTGVTSPRMLPCKTTYPSSVEFEVALNEQLLSLACKSPDLAHGILYRLRDYFDNPLNGFDIAVSHPLLKVLTDELSAPKNPSRDSCIGLISLPINDLVFLEKNRPRLRQQQ